MKKLTVVAFALIFAVLAGCVSKGEMIGTGGGDSPFPSEPEIHAGG